MNEWILSSSVLILIVIALRSVFKGRISLGLQYAIWGLVLLRLFIPFSFGSSSISVANLTNRVERPVVEQQPETPDVTIPADHNVHSTAPQPEQKPSQENVSEKPGTAEKPFNWAGAVEILWAVGAVCVAGLFLGTNLRFKNAVTRSRQPLEIRKNKLAVYVTDRIDTPCLFGFLDPGIYVTNLVARDQTLLRHTLEHEATHYRHGDHIWAVLRCVCLVVHWYNPLVWWAAFLSQRDGELACDEATIRRLGEGERAEYGRTLISMTCRKRANVLVTATTMTASKSGIRERILLIAKKPKMALYTLIIVLLIAAIAVGCTFTGGEEDTTGELSGTSVFPSGSEVTGITVHGQPDSQVSVDAAYLSEMEAWAKSFVYGDTVDANKEFDPGSNACSITLHYDDGTEVTCYLDYQIVNGATYRIIRDALPQCWEDVWRSEDNEQTEPTLEKKPTVPQESTPETQPTVATEPPTPSADDIVKLPQPQSVVPLPEQVAANTLVTPIPCEDLQWEDSLGNSFYVTLQIPQFCPFSQGAINAQSHLNEIMRPMLDNLAQSMDGRYSPNTVSISYESGLWREILSVLITVNSGFGDKVYYYTYNLNIETGEWLDNEALLEMLDIDHEHFVSKVATAAGERFHEKYDPFVDTVTEEFVQQQYDDTVAPENIEAAWLYLTDSGELKLMVKVYSLVGANSYMEEFDWNRI